MTISLVTSPLARSAPISRIRRASFAIAVLLTFVNDGRIATVAEGVVNGADVRVDAAGADASLCSDDHSECPLWARMGECDSVVMITVCQKSCLPLLCGGSDVGM